MALWEYGIMALWHYGTIEVWLLAVTLLLQSAAITSWHGRAGWLAGWLSLEGVEEVVVVGAGRASCHLYWS